jgi:cellulose synthase/poly-beta-1,6-N-acetylglucosamine synthase-like glycosyltransferase
MSFVKSRVNFTHLPLTPGRPVYRYTAHPAAHAALAAEYRAAWREATQPRHSWAPHTPASTDPAPPPLSIITPVYNTREFSVADSILRGSWQHFEWIIVNDGSTDEQALAQLAPFRHHPDSRIRFVDLPTNVGLPAARNRGMSLARGDILLFADADDIFEPTYLEKCILFLHFHPHHAACGAWSFNFGVAGREFAYDSPGFQRNGHTLMENHLMSMSLVRRSAVESVGGYDESLRQGLEDWCVHAAAR